MILLIEYNNIYSILLLVEIGQLLLLSLQPSLVSMVSCSLPNQRYSIYQLLLIHFIQFNVNNKQIRNVYFSSPPSFLLNFSRGKGSSWLDFGWRILCKQISIWIESQTTYNKTCSENVEVLSMNRCNILVWRNHLNLTNTIFPFLCSKWTTELLGWAPNNNATNNSQGNAKSGSGTNNNNNTNNNHSEGVPSHLVCPLTYEIFEEAVISPYGSNNNTKQRWYFLSSNGLLTDNIHTVQ